MDWSTIPLDLFNAWVLSELRNRPSDPTNSLAPFVALLRLSETDKAVSLKSFLNTTVSDNTDKFNQVDTDAAAKKKALSDDNQKANAAIAVLPK